LEVELYLAYIGRYLANQSQMSDKSRTYKFYCRFTLFCEGPILVDLWKVQSTNLKAQWNITHIKQDYCTLPLGIFLLAEDYMIIYVLQYHL